MKSVFLLLAAAALSPACKGPAAKSDPAPAAAVAHAAASDAGSKGTHITVTLTGGPNAGTYQADSKESTCSMGLTGEKSFGNQYSVADKSGKELSSVQMIAEDYDEAKKGTDNFNIMIGFGKLFGGASYNLNPPKNDGTGKLTITEGGGGRTATVEGKTKDGVEIKAVIICNTIQRIVDGELKEQ